MGEVLYHVEGKMTAEEIREVLEECNGRILGTWRSCDICNEVIPQKTSYWSCNLCKNDWCLKCLSLNTDKLCCSESESKAAVIDS